MAKIEPANLLLKDKNGNTGLVKSLTNKDITTLKNVVTNVNYIKDFVNANGGSLPIQGDLKLTATDAAGKNGKILLGTSSGTLQWNGKNIVRTVNGTNADANGNIAITSVANATNATKATQDSKGNVITDTYLKKSGDIMTGGLGFSRDGYIFCSVDNSGLTITGGNGWNKGGALALSGIKNTDNPGSFLLSTKLEDSSFGPQLRGTREGLLQWNGTNLARTVNGTYADADGNIAITSVASSTKATQDGAGNVITDTYVKKTGAVLSGDLGFSSTGYIYETTNDKQLMLAGGNGWNNGAGLALQGKDQSDNPGGFLLSTRLSDAKPGYQLRGTREGLLQWSGTNLVRSVNGVRAGDNGNVQLGLGVYLVQSWRNKHSWYRVWSDGWCEQGATNDVGYGSNTITLLKAFKDNQYNVLLTRHDPTVDDHVMSGSLQGTFNTSNFTVNCEVYKHNGVITWRAYGYVTL